MALLNSYVGVILVFFGSVITMLLIISRNKSAQYEAVNDARISELQDSLNSQHNALKHNLQSVRELVEKFAQFHNKNFSLLSDRIEKSDAIAQRTVNDLQKSFISSLEDGVSALDVKIQQIHHSGSEAIAATEQRLFSQLESMTAELSEQTQQLHTLYEVEVSTQQDVEALKKQQHKQMQELRYLGGIVTKTGQSLLQVINQESNQTRDLMTNQSTDLNNTSHAQYNHYCEMLQNQVEQLTSVQSALTQHQSQHYKALSDEFTTHITHYVQRVSALQETVKQQLIQQIEPLHKQIKHDSEIARDQETQLRHLLGKQLENTNDLHQNLQHISEKTVRCIYESADNVRTLLSDISSSQNEHNNAADANAIERHQALITTLQQLEKSSASQFESVIGQNNDIKYELIQHQCESDQADRELLQEVLEKVLSQLHEDTCTVISGIQKAAQNTGETIHEAKEKLIVDNQLISATLQQLSSDLEQHTSAASERNIAAVTDAYDGLHGLVKSGINTTHADLQALGSNVEGLFGDTEERYLEALSNASSQITQRFEDSRDTTMSNLQKMETTLQGAISHTEGVLQEATRSAETNTKKTVRTAEEKLSADNQSVSTSLRQLSADLEQHTSAASERNIAAITDAYDGIHGLVESEMNTTRVNLQALSSTVEGLLGDTEGRYLEALNKASGHITKGLADNRDATISDLQQMEVTLKDTICHTEAALLKATQSVGTNTEKAIRAAEEKLSADNQLISVGLKQLSSDLEKHTSAASEQSIAAIIEAYDDIHGLVKNEMNTTQTDLQTLGSTVQGLFGDTEERYLEALSNTSDQITQSLTENRDATISDLKQMNTTLKDAISHTEAVLQAEQQEFTLASAQSLQQIETTLIQQSVESAEQFDAIIKSSEKTQAHLSDNRSTILDGLQKIQQAVQQAARAVETQLQTESSAIAEAQQQIAAELIQQLDQSTEAITENQRETSRDIAETLQAGTDTHQPTIEILDEIRGLANLLTQQLELPSASADHLSTSVNVVQPPLLKEHLFPEEDLPPKESLSSDEHLSPDEFDESSAVGEVVLDTDEALTVLYNGKIQKVTDKVSGLETVFEYNEGVCRKARSYLNDKLQYEVLFDEMGKMIASTEFDQKGQDKSVYSYNSFGEVEKFEELP
ncbi:hypothetical protein [Oceanospirillum beijerinckii]|uniref:hypothetical protein n=1 Tax=Oceanospirillum beijerinckii TaxID=64976 RepID=UPI00041D33C0|nr:hypothetical protein [Oceanospirillum beijerinckii]